MSPPISHEESEKALIASILIANSVVDQAIDLNLQPEDFYSPKHKVLFESILNLNKKRVPIDLITLSDDLKVRGEFESVGGGQFLEYFEDLSNPKNSSGYIRTIQEKAILRKTVQILNQLLRDAFETNQVDEFIDSMQSQILEISSMNKRSGEVGVKDAFDRALLRLTQKEAQDPGLMTGFTEIDQLTNGMRPGNLIIVAGRPSMGKTSFVQSILIHQYRNKNLSTVFFSLEMSEAEIMDRTMSGMARINSTQLRLRSLEVKDFSKLMEISHGEQIGESNTFCDFGGLTVQEMRSICKLHLLNLKRLDLIVVDYLQIMGIPKSAQGLNRDRQIAEISMALKNMAKEFKVPVIVLSQLNRGVESRMDKRPLLSDLRDSGSIEQDADLVAFLYRDEYYHKNSTTPGVTEFILAKNRFGRLGNVNLKWTGEYTLLENLPRVGLQVVR